MDRKDNYHISSRHKRRLAQEETEKDLLLASTSSSGATYFEPSVESIKKCRIENDPSVSSSSSDQEHINQYSPNSDNNDNELLSDEIHNSSEVVTDDENFVDSEEQEEMQPLSFDSDDSSDDADMDIEYIDDEDERRKNASKNT
ncbi:CREB3 regulatory factor-like [Odontomachus brunneus]|uniref:CREB3 regulatory factor-like n=1 Tax=Odontomachus brunneus TaxID=486640 RepID=UPI0013F24E69|nr:CREB3 regulatory factor-like [Odontomachus brunneus]